MFAIWTAKNSSENANRDLQFFQNDLQFGGTVGGFRSSVLKSLHGWAASVLVEDTDLTFRVYLAGYKIRYSVDAECYEQAVIIGSHIGDKGIGGQKVTCNVSLSIHGAF